MFIIDVNYVENIRNENNIRVVKSFHPLDKEEDTMGKVLRVDTIHTLVKNNSHGDDRGDNFKLSTRQGEKRRYSPIYQQGVHSLSPEGVGVCGL